jgi:hypothetical protein
MMVHHYLHPDLALAWHGPFRAATMNQVCGTIYYCDADAQSDWSDDDTKGPCNHSMAVTTALDTLSTTQTS